MLSVLSIQSHVAFGYVGNRAAAFLLQRMGIDTTVINTVQFSNHTGYGEWTGQVFGADHVSDLLDGLAKRDVFSGLAAVLSGYMGAAPIGDAILDAVSRTRAANPDAVYCCDPVMGDVGRGFFVHEAIPPYMRDKAVPAADIVTPNQFEVEALTGIAITDMASALKAAAALRASGPSIALITSFTLPDDPVDEISILVDTAEGTWRVVTPQLGLSPAPNGSGDSIAALYLGHFLKTRDPVEAAIRAAAGIFTLFEATAAAGTRELQIIAAQEIVVDPPRRFQAVQIR